VLFVFTTTVWVFTSYLFVFSGRIDMFVSPLVAVGFVTAILWSIVNVVDVVLDRLVSFEGGEMTGVGAGREEQRQLATNIAAARRAVIVMVVLIGGGIVLRQANVLQTLGFSLLASAGAMTLVIAFAARNVLANIMASLQIALNRSAKIGDELLFKGYICHVERINFTFVQLRVWTGERLVVPVTDFVQEIYENWTLQDGSLTRKVELKLAPEADLPAIRELYHRVLDEGDWTLADPVHRGVHVTGQDVFGIDVLFRVPTVDAQESWVIACDVQEKLVAEIVRLERERGETWFPEVSAADAA